MNYESTAEVLVQRILTLMPDHPDLQTMDDPWKLFGVKGFACSDLQPSAFQAGWALRQAQKRYRMQKEGSET